MILSRFVWVKIVGNKSRYYNLNLYNEKIVCYNPYIVNRIIYGRRALYDNNVDKEAEFPDKKDALCSLYHEVSGCVQSGIAAC